jgi:Tol biopolymer transport system component
MYESCNATISGDGTRVAFEVLNGILFPNFPRSVKPSVFVRDLSTGGLEWVNQGELGPDKPVQYQPSISGDGRYVAFIDRRPLIPSDTNGLEDVYVRDLVARNTFRVSEGPFAEANARSLHTTISDDGSVIGFMSYASNLILNDTNGVADIFVGGQ